MNHHQVSSPFFSSKTNQEQILMLIEKYQQLYYIFFESYINHCKNGQVSTVAKITF